MSGPVETRDYGLAVAPAATLLLAACDRERTPISMADWAAKRREQMMARARNSLLYFGFRQPAVGRAGPSALHSSPDSESPEHWLKASGILDP
jgi:hypothetical protein